MITSHKVWCWLRSVKAFAEEYKKKGYPIHGLINNAGIFLVKPEQTPDGFEVTALSLPLLAALSATRSLALHMDPPAVFVL